MVHRKTQRGRLVRKLKELRQQLKRRMHAPLREQHGWLARVLRGHYAYYGVTGNSYGLRRFLTQAVRAWHGAIWRRGQKRRMSMGPVQCPSARQPAAAAEARSRLARPSGLRRGYSSEEPDAGKLQVRICGGGGGRPSPLPDRNSPQHPPQFQGVFRLAEGSMRLIVNPRAWPRACPPAPPSAGHDEARRDRSDPRSRAQCRTRAAR